MQFKSQLKARKDILSYGFLGLVGMFGAAYLGADGGPGWVTGGWLMVVGLSAWGLGWSAASLMGALKSPEEGAKRKAAEIGIWLALTLVAMGAACWRMGGQTRSLFPALALISLSVGMLQKPGWISGIIWGFGGSLLAMVGWAAVNPSLFSVKNGLLWFLAAFLFLRLMGCEAGREAPQAEGTGIEERVDYSQEAARLVHLVSLAPLFFLGQMAGMGVIYGILLFFMLVVSEGQYRKVGGHEWSQANYLLGILLVAALLAGRVV